MKYSGAWLLVENFWSISLVSLLIIIFIILFDKFQKNHTVHDSSEQANKDKNNWVARIDLISFRFGFIFLILIFAILFWG